METLTPQNLVTLLYPKEIKSCALVDIAFDLYNNFEPYDLTEKEYLFYDNSFGFFNPLEAALIQEARHKELGDIIGSATQIQDLFDVKTFEAKLYMAVSSSPFSNVFAKNDLYKRLSQLSKGEIEGSPPDQYARNLLMKLRNQMIHRDNAAYQSQKFEFNIDFYSVEPKKNWIDFKRRENNKKIWLSQAWRVVGAAIDNRSDFGFTPATAKEYHSLALDMLSNIRQTPAWKNTNPLYQQAALEEVDKMALIITSNFEAYFLNNNLASQTVDPEKTLSSSIKEVKDKLVSTFTGKKPHKI